MASIVSNKKSKIIVWRHFGYVRQEDGKIKEKTVICRLCKWEIPYSGNTTNLCAHLQNHHKAQYLELKKVPEKQETIQSTIARSQPLPTLSPRYKELVSAVGSFLAMDMQPMSSVEGCGFLKLMQVAEPRFTAPSRKYFSKTLLPEMYKTEKQRC